jgi:transposase
LHTLLEFPTSEAVLKLSETELAERISSLCMNRSEHWSREKAQKLMAAAARNPFRNARYQSHLISLEMYINMFIQYKEHLSNLEKQIDALAKEIEEYKIILSIPG